MKVYKNMILVIIIFCYIYRKRIIKLFCKNYNKVYSNLVFVYYIFILGEMLLMDSGEFGGDGGGDELL